MFKLYELSDSIIRVAEMMDEGAEGLEDTLEALDLSFQQKVESIVKLIQAKAAERDAVDTERARLANRAQKIDKQVQWLHDYVEREMTKAGMLQVKSDLFKIKLQMSPPRVEVTNQAELPDRFIRHSMSVAADKVAIKAAIANGETVPGAEIKQDLRLKIN